MSADDGPRPSQPPAVSRESIEAWRLAARTEPVDSTLRSIYREIAESTRTARPICVASGKCCRFEAYGHRLYVTGLEVAWFLDQFEALGRSVTLAEIAAARGAGTCPFLAEGFCSVHTIRPFACRTFFCDPRSEAWQTELHESCHGRVRALHEQLQLPYWYGEWRQVLEAASAPPTEWSAGADA